MVTALSESQPVKTSCLLHLMNVEQESTLEKLIKNRGAGALPLVNVEQESFSNSSVNGQIPQIVIHPSNNPNDCMSEFLPNDTVQNEPEVTVAAEPPAEKKGTMHALRK